MMGITVHKSRVRLLLCLSLAFLIFVLFNFHQTPITLNPVENVKSKIYLNMIDTPYIEPVQTDLVYFNRVPKTGSENFVFIIHHLAEMNNFTQNRFGAPQPRHLNEKQLSREQRRFCDLERPALTDRHVHYLGSSLLCPVTWISMVRSPVDWHVSRFRYGRLPHHASRIYSEQVARGFVVNQTEEEWRKKDLSTCILAADPECLPEKGTIGDPPIAYFCGQESYCMEIGSKKALARAKTNVEQAYPVVGVLEQLDATLTVLEARLPQFFLGAPDLYYGQLKEPHKNRQKKRSNITLEAKQALLQNMGEEQEFYVWLVARLEAQHRALIDI